MTQLGMWKLGALSLALLTGLAARADDGPTPDWQSPAEDVAWAAGGSSTTTRAEVVAELMQAQADGTLLAAGEQAESPAVLDARERFNVAQAQAITARYARIEAENAERVRLAAEQAAADAAARATAAVTPTSAGSEAGDGSVPTSDVAAAPAALGPDTPSALASPVAGTPDPSPPPAPEPTPALAAQDMITPPQPEPAPVAAPLSTETPLSDPPTSTAEPAVTPLPDNDRRN
jgi:hypothetical protein